MDTELLCLSFQKTSVAFTLMVEGCCCEHADAVVDGSTLGVLRLPVGL